VLPRPTTRSTGSPRPVSAISPDENAATSVNARAVARMRSNGGQSRRMRSHISSDPGAPRQCGNVFHTATNRCGSPYASGRRSTARTTL
jgi:hypothetical protein